MRGTKEYQRVTVVNVGVDEIADQDGSGVRGERWAETINVTSVEMCRAGYVLDV